MNSNSAPSSNSPTPSRRAQSFWTLALLLLAALAAVGPYFYREERQTRLIDAVRQGDLETVSGTLRRGANPNDVCLRPDGTTHSLLAEAASGGHPEVAEALLDAGADPNAGNVLHDAIYGINGAHDVVLHPQNRSRKQIAEEVKKGAVFNRLVHRLILKGANVNFVDHTDIPILMTAVDTGDLEIIQLLLDRGADPNLRVQGHVTYTSGIAADTALKEAVGQRNSQIVTLLLQRGARTDFSPEKEGITSLMVAAEAANIEIVNILLKAGANPNVKNTRGLDALSCAKVALKNTKRRYSYFSIPPNLQVIQNYQRVIDTLSKETNGNKNEGQR